MVIYMSSYLSACIAVSKQTESYELGDALRGLPLDSFDTLNLKSSDITEAALPVVGLFRLEQAERLI